MDNDRYVLPQDETAGCIRYLDYWFNRLYKVINNMVSFHRTKILDFRYLCVCDDKGISPTVTEKTVGAGTINNNILTVTGMDSSVPGTDMNDIVIGTTDDGLSLRATSNRNP